MNEREISRDWHLIGDKRENGHHDRDIVQSPKRTEDPNGLNVTMQFKQLMMCVEEDDEEDTLEAKTPQLITAQDLENFED